ncbi:hypothetical protein N2152v2_003907 [Parachlorella kessleri]
MPNGVSQQAARLVAAAAAVGGNSATDCGAGLCAGAGHDVSDHAVIQPAKNSAEEAHGVAAGSKELPALTSTSQPVNRRHGQQPQSACAWKETHGPSPTNHRLPPAQPASCGHAALSGAELPACSLNNVKPLALGQQQLIDLLYLEGALQASQSTPPGLSAVQGALVRCKRGGRYSWQQVKRAVQQSPGAWKLEVGQGTRPSLINAGWVSNKAVSTSQAEIEEELAALSAPRQWPTMFNSRQEVAEVQWRLQGATAMLAKIRARTHGERAQDIRVGSSALAALIATLQNPRAIAARLAKVERLPTQTVGHEELRHSGCGGNGSTHQQQEQQVQVPVQEQQPRPQEEQKLQALAPEQQQQEQQLYHQVDPPMLHNLTRQHESQQHLRQQPGGQPAAPTAAAQAGSLPTVLDQWVMPKADPSSMHALIPPKDPRRRPAAASLGLQPPSAPAGATSGSSCLLQGGPPVASRVAMQLVQAEQPALQLHLSIWEQEPRMTPRHVEGQQPVPVQAVQGQPEGRPLLLQEHDTGERLQPLREEPQEHDQQQKQTQDADKQMQVQQAEHAQATEEMQSLAPQQLLGAALQEHQQERHGQQSQERQGYQLELKEGSEGLQQLPLQLSEEKEGPLEQQLASRPESPTSSGNISTQPANQGPPAAMGNPEADSDGATTSSEEEEASTATTSHLVAPAYTGLSLSQQAAILIPRPTSEDPQAALSHYTLVLCQVLGPLLPQPPQSSPDPMPAANLPAGGRAAMARPPPPTAGLSATVGTTPVALPLSAVGPRPMTAAPHAPGSHAAAAALPSPAALPPATSHFLAAGDSVAKLIAQPPSAAPAPRHPAGGEAVEAVPLPPPAGTPATSAGSGAGGMGAAALPSPSTAAAPPTLSSAGHAALAEPARISDALLKHAEPAKVAALVDPAVPAEPGGLKEPAAPALPGVPARPASAIPTAPPAGQAGSCQDGQHPEGPPRFPPLGSIQMDTILESLRAEVAELMVTGVAAPAVFEGGPLAACLNAAGPAAAAGLSAAEASQHQGSLRGALQAQQGEVFQEAQRDALPYQAQHGEQEQVGQQQGQQEAQAQQPSPPPQQQYQQEQQPVARPSGAGSGRSNAGGSDGLGSQGSVALLCTSWDPVLVLEAQIVSYLMQSPWAPRGQLVKDVTVPEHCWYAPGGVWHFCQARPHLFSFSKDNEISSVPGAEAVLVYKCRLLEYLGDRLPRLQLSQLEQALPMPRQLQELPQLKDHAASLRQLLQSPAFCDSICVAGTSVELRPIYELKG